MRLERESRGSFMSGIREFFSPYKPQASDGGLAKGVGEILNKPAPEPEAPPQEIKRLPLSFEAKVKGSAVWSDALRALLRASSIPDIALSDADDWCPRYSLLNREYRIEFWAHFWAIVMKYECDYDPRCFSVDVGNKNDRNTWSVGLLQLSVCDQPNYGFKLGYTFEDLQDPIKNMILGVKIAEKLIRDDRMIGAKVDGHWRGLTRYWGTLREGRDTLTGIRRYMRNLKFLPEIAPKEDETPEQSKKKIGVVVGHERIAPGAQFCEPYRGVYEYDYNSEVAHLMFEHAHSKNVDLEIFFRDGVGISGAYKAARAANCDVVIELHCNAYDGHVYGTETLCSSNDDDKRLATAIQNALVSLFGRSGRGDRGVKITDSGRGAESCVSFPGKANVLVEPGFCDNPQDAKALMSAKRAYAAMLVDTLLG